jgi:hypothetical protein
VDALTRLLDLSDNALMDLLLARKEPEGEVDLPHVHACWQRLRLPERLDTQNSFFFICASLQEGRVHEHL